MTKFKVLWVDDDDERAKDAAHLNDSKLQIDFVSNGASDLTPSAMAKYDLCLIDYRLENLDRTLKGPAIVGKLRSASDETPAYLVTNEPPASISKFSGVGAFEVILAFAEVQDVVKTRLRFKADIAGYRAIRAIDKNLNPLNSINALLKTPDVCRESLAAAIPASIRTELFKHREPSEYAGRLGFSRWVRRVLLSRSGPLLPALHAATRLGVTETKFTKTKTVKPALYDGVFSGSTEPRWWREELDELVFGGVPGGNVGVPWKVGPGLLKAKPGELATCAVCDEGGPDIVARSSAPPFKEHAVHQRHTFPDPSIDFVPFFAEERMFDEAD